MRIDMRDNTAYAIIEKDSKAMGSVQDTLDLMAAYGCIGLIVDKDMLDKKYFDPKNKFAVEVLQKFSDYNIKVAIIGDFKEYNIERLNDFIYEFKKDNLVFFKDSIDEGINAIFSSI